MDSRSSLTQLLAASLGPRHAVDLERVAAPLGAALDTARARWAAWVTPAAFVEYIAARLPPDADPCETLPELNAEDLYLTCSCLAGVDDALQQFEVQYFRPVVRSLARLTVAGRDDAEQALREMLLVASAEGRSPGLASYKGRGSLRGWLRVVAARTVHRLAAKPRELPLDDAVDRLVARGDDPELARVRQLYRGEFRQALEHALSTLSSRQRNVLRQRYLDRLSVNEIGVVYDVHRVTVSRWLAEAREHITDAVREHMTQRMRLSPSDYRSVVRLIRSDLDLSLERVLHSVMPVTAGDPKI